MKGVVHEIQSYLENGILERVTAANERKMILHFKGKPSLLLCFQEPFLRFHLTKYPWKDHPHSFNKKVTQALHGWHVAQCNLLQEDKILELVFKKRHENKKLVCEFIPKKSNCYLLDGEQQIIASLHPVEHNRYNPPKPLMQTTPGEKILSSSEIEDMYLPLEGENDFNEKKQEAESQLKKQHKHLIRAKDNLANELDEAMNWEKVQHEATLLQSHLFKIHKGMSKVTLNDWLQDNAEIEIEIDATLSPSEEIERRFQKSKKLKRGIEPLKRKLEQIQKKAENINGLLAQLEEIKTENGLKNFLQKNYLAPTKTSSKKPVKIEPAMPYREFFTASGLQIWVGKSAKDNDKLTFSYGNGSDLWLHAHDVPGSHVVLHLGSKHEADDESLKDAIQAALFFSKAKDRKEGEVCITQCKYVSRFGKNQPGKVQISHHRVVYAKIDLARLQHLKERKNNKNQ